MEIDVMPQRSPQFPLIRNDLQPFSNMNVPTLLRHKAKAHPDKVFLAWEPLDGTRQQFTYDEFYQRVLQFAAGLMKQGVKPGQHVILHMDNCPEFLIAWHACSRVGAIVVTTNNKSTANEFNYFVKKCAAQTVIIDQHHDAVLTHCRSSLQTVISKYAPPGVTSQSIKEGYISFDDCKDDPGQLPEYPIDSTLPNSVQFTSGTTANPKGVVWTHANALWCASTTTAHLGLDETDVALTYLPLFHTNAQAYAMLSTLWSSGKLVLMPKFSASRFWEVACRHNCTWASMIPFTVNAVASQPDPVRPHSFRLWAPGAHIPSVEERWGIKTLGWWGMTETISQPIVGKPGFPTTPGAIGTLAPEYEITIRDEAGKNIKAGETGRLYVRGICGLSLFKEYLNDAEATISSFDDNGWFDTGDMVTLLETGEIVFSDRAKDIIRTGAENIAASEIEKVIAAVAGVSEVAVVAKTHPMLEEVPAAYVIAEQAHDPALTDTILTTCREQLSSFKVPHDVIFVDEFPRSLLNKVDKKALREALKSDTET